jgi:hypothetical protein
MVEVSAQPPPLIPLIPEPVLDPPPPKMPTPNSLLLP